MEARGGGQVERRTWWDWDDSRAPHGDAVRGNLGAIVFLRILLVPTIRAVLANIGRRHRRKATGNTLDAGHGSIDPRVATWRARLSLFLPSLALEAGCTLGYDSGRNVDERSRRNLHASCRSRCLCVVSRVTIRARARVLVFTHLAKVAVVALRQTRLVAKLSGQAWQTEREAFRRLRIPHRAGFARIE